MIYSKSVVLNSVDNSLKKAVLKIESQAGNVNGEVKLYNFQEEPMGVLSLGLFVDGKVLKAGLTRTGYLHYSFGSIFTKIPSSCTCALVQSHGGNMEPLLIGTIDQNSCNSEEMLLQSLGVLKEKSVQKVEEVLNENNIIYEEQEEVEKEIDKCFENCSSCQNCHYKKAFYDEKESILNDIKNDITRGKMRIPNESINFIDEISSQIDTLFEKYPQEKILMDIIPNSKWVKVDFNNDNNYYVVGLIYENEVVKYICYGLPARWSETPPKEFNKKAQWLPIDLSDYKGAGYWITYQDAVDGDLVQVNII